MSEPLRVYWGSTLVGALGQDRRGLAFSYEGIDRPMISVAMPTRSAPYREDVARPFFRGLLPEGEARRMIAYDLGLGNDGGTDFEMLRALGVDCAGALVITDGEVPPGDAPAGEPSRLDEAAVGRKLRSLPSEPLGVAAEVRVSLTGVQPKLPLAMVPDGSWALPGPGRPSTHILKPPSTVLPDSVPNEVFCMKLASNLGVKAAETQLVTFDGMPTMVSTRYDRVVDRGGNTTRIHQEDGCQALSIDVGDPRAKYQQADGSGPSLRAIAGVLARWSVSEALDELLAHAFVTTLVGNADFHGKNVSLLHAPAGIRLAPMYDVMSTVDLAVAGGQVVSPRLGMHIGGATDVHAVGVEELLAEAESWGIRRRRAERLLGERIEQLPVALDAASAAVPTMPGSRIEVIRARASELQRAAARW